VLFVPTLFPFTFHWNEGVDPPFVGVAVKVIFTPAQAVIVETEMLTDGVTEGFTVIEILLLFAVVVVAQFAFDVNTQDTTSLFTKPVELNVDAFVPAFTPFSFHWNAGVDPPLVMVAVKVVFAPAQIVVEPVFTEIVGDTLVFTVIVMLLLFAFAEFTHDALDTIAQVTISPFTNVAELQVAVVAPDTFTLFTFHW
jgi:hypothetical protein